MNRVLILFILFFAFTSNRCRKEDKEIIIGNFDISNDDKQIVFSCYNNNSSSIYSMDINGQNTKLLVKASNIKSYFNPKYSHDCSKIVFIAYVNGDLKNCALFIANSDGTNIIRLTNGGEIITEVAFSSNDSEIFFCKANVFKKYSPLGQDQAHDFDIYSINIKKRKIKKISELKSY
jgi:TolB protein